MSTYTPIASVPITTTTASVSFAAIPQTYTDLVLVFSGTATAQTAATLRYNGDTGNNYSITYLYGDGSSVLTGTEANLSVCDAFYVSTIQSTGVCHIQNYSNTTTNKTFITRAGTTDSLVISYTGMWRNTSAITSMSVQLDSGSFNAGTTLNLYGINAQDSAQAKATGGSSIYTDGTFWYHIFTSSGTFTPNQSISNVDFLVIAGGGAGFGSYLGGGGAGGYRCSVTGESSGGGASAEAKLSLLAQAYPVTVGAGGTSGARGSNSTFATITSIGGGGAGLNGVSSGYSKDGGSGAGGGAQTISPAAGAGTANQGFAGGDGNPSNSRSAGGGGAGGAGASNAGQPNGGAGVTSSITGTAVARAGGGGGGADSGFGSAGTATAGGGAGSILGTATSGTANTGGGGGSPYVGTGGNGGSGIVIVRYAV